MLLKPVAHRQVTELGRVHVPAHRVASGEMAPGGRSRLHRHADPVAGVEPGAPDPGQIPARAQVPGAPGGAGLEPATGEHHGISQEGLVTHPHTADAPAAGHQRIHPGAVTNGDPGAANDVRQAVDEPGAPAPGFDGEPTPEAHATIDPERLAAVQRQEPDPMTTHPAQGIETRVDEPASQFRIGPVAGDPAHVLVELVAVIAAEVGARDLVGGQVRHQGSKVVHPVVDGTHGAGGEA